MAEEYVTDFVRYLKFEKRYSVNTIVAYEKDIEQFFSYLQQDFNTSAVQAITHFHVRSWLAGLKDRQQTERTLNRKMSALNAFLKYLLKNQVISMNPIRMLHNMRLPERLPAYVKESEISLLLEEIQFDEGFKGFTDRLICELLYQTGMRRNELVQLKEIDIEWGLRQLRILGKGNKERLVPLGEVLLKDLEHYINEKKNMEHSSDHDHLLILESGQPLYAGYVYRTVRRYLGAVTTLSKKSPHILRHSFATHLLNNGANIQAIKDLLGHSSLAATQVYTHNNIQKLKDIHKQSHPRA